MRHDPHDKQQPRKRAKQARLEERVRFALQDYRAIQGPFDRIVSVGMFEHVGTSHYARFFQKIRDLLSADGIALIHSIGRMNGPAVTSAWTRKYIFPGGHIPALSEVAPVIEHAGLVLTDLEILRLHYAKRFVIGASALREVNDRKAGLAISGFAACGNSTSPPASWHSDTVV